jgi:hypothetical protein
MSAAECEHVVASFDSRQKSGKWFKRDEFDTSTENSSEIRQWLGKVEMHGVAAVVWIGLKDGIRIAFKDFICFYDDLWFPSSDDVLLMSQDGNTSVMLSHEELFTWYSACD